MKCQSCGIEIPPQWTFALSKNTCPSCGKDIMSKDLQELINGLSDAMEKMPNNPQGVACWIVSNYKLEKINDYEPTLHAPKKPGVINNNAPKNDKQKALEEFFARANVDLSNIPELSKKAKKVPSPIKSEEDDVVEEESAEEVSSVKLDDVDKMILSSSGGKLSEDEKDEIAQMVQARKYGAEKNPTIAAMIEKQQQKQEDFANGISATDARGKPAGFRRAE